MRVAAIVPILALLPVFIFPTNLSCQDPYFVAQEIELDSSEKVSFWGILSYDKLRRGTQLEAKYSLFVKPGACLSLAEDPQKGRQETKLEVTAEPDLTATVTRLTKPSSRADVNGTKINRCAQFVEFRVRMAAPLKQPLGEQVFHLRMTWQVINAKGTLPAQITEFEVPLEIVEHDDRTARYNDSYAMRFTPDMLWRLPSFPFYMVYCLTAHTCPD